MQTKPALPEVDTYIVRVLRTKEDGTVVQEYIASWSQPDGMARTKDILAADINNKEWSEHVIETEKKFAYNKDMEFDLVKVSFTL